MIKRQVAVVMFSGGCDSFLSAVKTVEKGYFIELLTFDNGCMSWLESVKSSGDILCDKYPLDVSRVIVIQSSIERRLLSNWYNSNTLSDISRYSRLQPYQINCLHCHTAMYLKAIQYCKQRNIRTIVNGARECQGFVVESGLFVHSIYSSLAERYSVSVEYPVWELKDDVDRRFELVDRGFFGSPPEGQCWIGCPVKGSLSSEDLSCYEKYFNDILLPICHYYLDKQVY